MRKRAAQPRPEIPIAPMIDCVFLMLVYFMTTSSLERSETEQTLPIQGSGRVAPDPLQAVDEQQLSLERGAVEWNGSRFGIAPGTAEWDQLINRLCDFKATCGHAGTDPTVAIFPAPDATHQDLVTLLDAVRRAGIETLKLP